MTSKPAFPVVALLTAVIAARAGAQPGGLVRVLRAAAVVEQPAGDARPVATVNPGEVFEILDEKDSWVLVRPPSGSLTPEWRTGWLNRASVEPMSGGAASNARQSAPVPAPEVTEESREGRKGFILGVGAGAGIHATPTFRVLDRFGRVLSSGGGDNKLAISFDFNVGYAPGEQFLLYYSNKVAFTTDDRVDAVGVTGLGVSYYFRATTRSAFVNGTVGAGAARTFIGSSSGQTGPGFSIGGGYEFARHGSVNADAIFVRLAGGQDHTVYKVSLNYLFY